MPIDIWKSSALMNGWSHVLTRSEAEQWVVIVTNAITAWGTVCSRGGHIMFD